MKIIKTTNYKQSEDVTYEEVFKRNLVIYKDERKAAMATLDIITNGASAAFESDKMERMIQYILNKYKG